MSWFLLQVGGFSHATQPNPFWQGKFVDLFWLSLCMVGFCRSCLFMLVLSLNSSDFAFSFVSQLVLYSAGRTKFQPVWWMAWEELDNGQKL